MSSPRWLPPDEFQPMTSAGSSTGTRRGGPESPLPGFTPGPETVQDFRRALGRFATGVTVVTARDGEGAPVGITANSFASVSLDPPLVLWSPARRSARFPFFVQAPHWCVHILSHRQLPLARHFTRSGFLPPGMAVAEGEGGVPVLPGCLARFECQAERQIEGGDHLILLGRVLRAHAQDGDPLVFLGGDWGGFRL